MNDPRSDRDKARTVRVPLDVEAFAQGEAEAESKRTDRRVTTTDILRDLMREGKEARERKQESKS